MSFYDEIKKYDWTEIEKAIEACSPADVETALSTRSPLGLDSLIGLLSPAAENYLEEIAQRAHRLTEQRFGKTISLFAPIYLSNECTNSCAYCGFNIRNPIERLTLTVDQAIIEARHLHNQGFRHLLLVSGEAPNIASIPYMASIVEALRPLFPSISVEVYPMDTAAYRELIAHGVDGLVVFQETYNEARYGDFHLGGKKRNYRWRLETPDRGGEAGFRRLGLGALLGLCNWRTETFFLALHANYLMRKFWRSQITISFPRLQPAAGGFQPPNPVSDANMVQMLTALRLFLPDASLVLSTRETPDLRDHLIPLGITSMSAGSRTEPGGYAHAGEAEAQFEVADPRSPQAVAEVIMQKGYEPVWKDWDAAFLQ
jgi:2-iminoacetate synthase